MTINISSAPCCWGVDKISNPYLPPWQKVLQQASLAGYKGIELGPYGYLPLDIEVVSAELDKNGLSVVAGTIFDDLVTAGNLNNLIQQTHDICSLLTRLPQLPKQHRQHFATYLVIIDHVHAQRSLLAGHPDAAPRLSAAKWQRMMDHIRAISVVAGEYGVRPVIHPHAGGYIEFADEIMNVIEHIPYDIAGLCLDTGHLYYSKMDPIEWIRNHAERIDYLHFKDIDGSVYDNVMSRNVDFFDACAEGVMCSIGQGVIDYDGIYQLLQDIGYQGYITVEQERDPRNSDTSLRDVKASLEYLQGRGF